MQAIRSRIPFRALLHRPLITPRFSHRFLSTSVQRFDEFIPKKTAIGKINRRLQITFTCTADIPLNEIIEIENEETKPCGHRSTHEFSRVSYEKGIVLIECPGCKNRHLIGSSFLPSPLPGFPSPPISPHL